jgi:hypothetical protein
MCHCAICQYILECGIWSLRTVKVSRHFIIQATVESVRWSISLHKLLVICIIICSNRWVKNIPVMLFCNAAHNLSNVFVTYGPLPFRKCQLCWERLIEIRYFLSLKVCMLSWYTMLAEFKNSFTTITVTTIAIPTAATAAITVLLLT